MCVCVCVSLPLCRGQIWKTHTRQSESEHLLGPFPNERGSQHLPTSHSRKAPARGYQPSLRPLLSQSSGVATGQGLGKGMGKVSAFGTWGCLLLLQEGCAAPISSLCQPLFGFHTSKLKQAVLPQLKEGSRATLKPARWRVCSHHSQRKTWPCHQPCSSILNK